MWGDLIGNSRPREGDLRQPRELGKDWGPFLEFFRGEVILPPKVLERAELQLEEDLQRLE